MNNNTIKLILGGIAVIILLAVGWYLVSPLFITNTVDEAFPVELPSPAEAAEMPQEELEAVIQEAVDKAEEMGDDEMLEELEAEVQEIAEVMPDNAVEDDMPEEAVSAEPAIIATGNFVDADNAHRGSGTATIYTLEDGSSILRLEDFEVTNGPDLHVLLVKNPEPSSRADVGDDYIDLGSLKGNVGNQNYEISADVDLSEYNSVVIYCMPFHVVFSTATLSQ